MEDITQDKLTDEELDTRLLEWEGLLASVRNELSPLKTLISSSKTLIEEPKDSDTTEQIRRRIAEKEHFQEIILASEASLKNILKAVEYSAKLPWYKRIRIFKGWRVQKSVKTKSDR